MRISQRLLVVVSQIKFSFPSLLLPLLIPVPQNAVFMCTHKHTEHQVLFLAWYCTRRILWVVDGGRKKGKKKIFSAIDFSVSVFPSFFLLYHFIYTFGKKNRRDEFSEMIGRKFFLFSKCWVVVQHTPKSGMARKNLL